LVRESELLDEQQILKRRGAQRAAAEDAEGFFINRCHLAVAGCFDSR